MEGGITVAMAFNLALVLLSIAASARINKARPAQLSTKPAQSSSRSTT
ncbi:hypothetical protein [Paenibacillus sp. GCM10027626]